MIAECNKNYFVRIGMLCMLIFLFFIPLQAHATKTILNHTCKLGVTALVISGTLYQAKKIYKQEMLVRYAKEAAQKKIIVSKEQLEEKYGQEYSTQAFLKAYGRYLKDVFVGSTAWKKEHLWFVHMIYAMVGALGGATCFDYVLKSGLLKNQSLRNIPLQNINMEAPLVIAQTPAEVVEHFEDLKQRAQRNWDLVKPEQRRTILMLHVAQKLPVNLMEDREKIALLIKQIKPLDAIRLDRRHFEGSVFPLLRVRRPRMTSQQAVQQFTQLFVDRVLGELGINGEGPRPDDSAERLIRCEVRPLHDAGCSVCMKGSLERINELKKDIQIAQLDTVKNAQKIQDFKDELEEELACKNSYVFPCQSKVTLRPDGTRITPCKGAQVCCDDCVAELLKAHHYKCISCRAPFKL